MEVVSSRYARALFEALWDDSPSQADRGLEQLRAFAGVLKTHNDARQLLLNPAIPPERRERFISRVAEVLQLEARVRRLIGLMVERRRLNIIDDVADAYQKMLDDKKGIARAVVTSASPLDASQQQTIAAKLEAALGKRVVMETRRDADLLGGLVVRVGGTVYDGSLRQHLAALKSRLVTH